MAERQPQSSKKSGAMEYQITVKGNLAADWADLFNGVLINNSNDRSLGPVTVLTCQVQDQAEVNGIINWLHNFNLTLLEVKAIRKEN